MNEFCSKDQVNKNTTTWNAFEGLVIILITLMFQFVSTNALLVGIFSSTIVAINLIRVSLYLPESPKWLLSQKNYAECDRIIEEMKMVNEGSSYVAPEIQG